MHASAIKTCQTSCPRAVFTAELSARLEAAVAASGWPDFLLKRYASPRRHHHFRIAAASCANGCVRPHIADFGLISTARLSVHPEKCTACGQCLSVCAEDALKLDQEICLDTARCLGCAACVRVCSASALEMSGQGYRVLLGGKLGRHPRLAHELGFFSEKDALHILSATLTVLMNRYRAGQRLGDLIRDMGQENFDRLVRP